MCFPSQFTENFIEFWMFIKILPSVSQILLFIFFCLHNLIHVKFCDIFGKLKFHFETQYFKFISRQLQLRLLVIEELILHFNKFVQKLSLCWLKEMW